MSETILEVKNLRKSFGSKVVHEDISFKLKKGECLGLLGGSGTGKSVILRALIGLEKLDSGQIIYKNEEIQDFDEDRWLKVREKISYVFQNGALFDSLSVRENLAYPLREHFKLSEAEISKKITHLLNEIGLENTEELFPSELSGGMQKRVGLARSIILQPKVILYDEPTAGLDPYNTRRICDMILRLKERGATAIFVTHDMPAAFSVCDRIAVLKDGVIHAIGTREEIERKDPWVARFIEGEEL